MHTIEVSFTPICAHCGKEMKTHGIQSDPGFKPRGPFDRDDMYKRKDQRVFVIPCVCRPEKNQQP